MTPWKHPPKEKIYEAFSVLADNRYSFTGENSAHVHSSDDTRHYTVKWTIDGDSVKITSDDNGSRWQGYTGYPIIAILMIKNLLKVDPEIIPYFKSIPWNSLNKSFKNNYALAVESVLSGMQKDISEKIRKESDSVFEQLKALNLYR
ncbi:MAG TPA: hypothetical protein VK179_02450 [Bacteroidales bacterium]|nr:hypothetical protein [Bacteroidales bacterium]